MADFNKADSNRVPSICPVSSAAGLVRPELDAPLGFQSPRSSPNGWHKLEGTTSFEPSPSPSYRYALSQQNDKLHIWLEDCESKKQWGTAKMVLKDYVDLSNAIPAFGVSDYAALFHSALEKPLQEGSRTVPRAFQQIRGNSYRLEVSVEFNVMNLTKVASFSFELEPISLEPVDHLESKVRDLQEQMASLRCGGQMAGTPPVNPPREILAISAHVHDGFSIPDMILWKNGEVNEANLVQWVSNPGTFLVTVVVNHVANTADHKIQLMKGAECIQFVYSGFSSRLYASSTLMCVTHLEKNDMLTVKCPLTIVQGHSTLVRLGN